jgi:small subunit ribosomal protein S17
MAEEKDATQQQQAEETREAVDETPPVEEAAAETPAEEPVADAPAEEAVAEATAPEQPSAEGAPEPAGEASVEEAPEAAVEEARAEEAVADEEPAAEGVAQEAPAEEAAAEPEAAPTPTPEPKKKRKRVPRDQRRQRPKVRRERPAERKPIMRLPTPESERGRRQERRGVVVSAAMDKTIVVKVDTIKAHPRYKKVVRRSVKFHAHDEQNEAKVGDIVLIVETRPLSKTKNWRLARVVEAAR